MKGKKAGRWAIAGAGSALLVAFVLAGQMTVLNPEVQAQGKKNPPPPCSDVSVNLVLRDVGTDSVQSDGYSTYQALLSCNNDTNQLYSLFEGRAMHFRLTNPTVADNTFTLITEDPVSTNLGASIGDQVSILDLPVGQTGMTTKLQFNFVVGDKRYFLSWGSNYEGTSTVAVTRLADRWVIETAAQPYNIARLRECPAKGACKSPVDRLYYAPVRMDLFAMQ